MIRPILLDVSKWQGAMNWEVAFSAGARAAIIRAGSIDNVTGGCYKDSQFDNNTDKASQVMPVGYYWYFRPNQDPLLQADFFSELVAGSQFFRLFADIEENGGLPPGKVADQLALFVDKLRQDFGPRVGIYTRASFWNPLVARRDLWPLLDLWVARYINQDGPWLDDDGLRPLDWNDWRIWQYSADGNYQGADFGAQSNHIDMNVFNGDFQTLSDYCGTEVSPITEPEPWGEPVVLGSPKGICRVLPPVLNLRSNASFQSADLGDLSSGTELYWFEHVVDAEGNDWLRVGPSVYISEVFKGNRLVERA